MGDDLHKISVLSHDEPVFLDQEQLNMLYAQLGAANADGVVCRALEELANRLSLIERSYYQNNRPALLKAARGMIGIADQMGMKGLSDAAAQVVGCCGKTDEPALAATLARLVRLGDRYLTAIWDVQDMNGVTS